MLIYAMGTSVDGFIADRAGAFVDGPERGAGFAYERYRRARDESD